MKAKRVHKQQEIFGEETPECFVNQFVKQDINFLEYPLWMQNERLPEGFVWRDRNGFIYRAGYKPPSKTDIIFLLYLLMRSQQEGWRQEMVLSQREILTGCGIQPGKSWYERLKDSLERWTNTTVKFAGTFYDGREYLTMNFNIIEAWKIEKKSKKLVIRFSPEWLTRIKESNFFKLIDFEQLKSLRSPLAVRLYELLIKTFQGRKSWSIEATKLAQKIPMNEKHPAHIIPKVRAAVNRITRKTNLKISLEVERPRRGQAIFHFYKEDAVEETEKRSNAEELEALLKLVRKGFQDRKTIREAIARALAKKGREYVERNIKYANQFADNNYRVYLLRALKENWAASWWEEIKSGEKDLEKFETIKAMLKPLIGRRVRIGETEGELSQDFFLFVSKGTVWPPKRVFESVEKYGVLPL